jgi:hypothetical protein
VENFITENTETAETTVETTVETANPSVNNNDSVQEIVILDGFKKLKGKLKTSDCGLYPMNKIIKGENIRDEAKLIKSLPPLMESIAKHGIRTPLEINTNGKLIDGFCRYACAIKLGLSEVPVIVINIPDSEIPFHQFTTMLRTGIDESEKGKAVFTYTLLNPEIKQVRIAEMFSVSTEFVSRASRVIAKGDVITKAVTSGITSPTTAWSIVDNSNDKNFIHAENLLFDKLNALEDETEENKLAKPVKPITLKTINAELVKAGLDPINKETKTVKEESPKAFDKGKVIEFIETLDGKINGDLVTLSGAVSLEVWQYIQSVIARNKKFNCTTITVRDIENELDLYNEYTQNGECFVQVEVNEYISFNPLLAEYGLTLAVENQLERVKVSKSQLNSVVNKIQMDVTIVNQLKFQQPIEQTKKTRTKKNKAITPIPELTTEVTEEIEADIQASILNSLDTLDNQEPDSITESESLNVETETETETELEETAATQPETESESESAIDENIEDEFTDLIYETLEIEPEFEEDLEIEINF